MLYKIHYVVLYKKRYVKLYYKKCYVMLYNIRYVMLYNIHYVILHKKCYVISTYLLPLLPALGICSLYILLLSQLINYKNKIIVYQKCTEEVTPNENI